MKEVIMFSEIVLYFIISFYLFYKIQLILKNIKFKQIDKNKYRLLKSKDNTKFKMEFFENEKWKEMDTIDACSYFFLFKNIQEELNAKEIFINFVSYCENKEEINNKKENKELEYEIVN